jgi:hypothetical protein
MVPASDFFPVLKHMFVVFTMINQALTLMEPIVSGHMQEAEVLISLIKNLGLSERNTTFERIYLA